MIALHTIKDRTQDQDLWTFAAFVISATEGRNFPDYKAMDLMKIAKLVQHCWVFDFRSGLDDGLPFHFSGTAIDAQLGRTLTGLDFEKVYPGEYFEDLITNTYHQVYLQKRPCYTRRIERYLDDVIDKQATVETVVFPCSSDGENINFGLGMTKYTRLIQEGGPEFVLL